MAPLDLVLVAALPAFHRSNFNKVDIFLSIAEYEFADVTWAEFFAHVQAGLQEHGDQYEWLLDWSNNRHKGNILFIKYEDMKKDIVSELTKIAAFLGMQLL